MLPFASGILGSSGEKRHSPSTMNLYLYEMGGTGGDRVEVAVVIESKYNCD